jgi:hypothetical protein
MRYNGAIMSERAVKISETYTPGRNLGGTRRVTVDGIPAIEVTYDGVKDVATAFGVFERIDVLIQRALESNDAAEQRMSISSSRFMRYNRRNHEQTGSGNHADVLPGSRPHRHRRRHPGN